VVNIAKLFDLVRYIIIFFSILMIIALLIPGSSLTGFAVSDKFSDKASDITETIGEKLTETNEEFISASSGVTNVSACRTLNSARETYVIIQDINATGDCFTVSTDIVTLDCNGFSITGDGSGTFFNSNGWNNLTVKNCTITNFSNGIIISNSALNIVADNTIDTMGNYGISFGNANRSTIINNVIEDAPNGINIQSCGSDYLINNTVHTSPNIGIYLDGANNNVLDGNTVYNSQHGIYASTNAMGNTLQNNNLSNNTNGIYFSTASNNNIIDNTIDLNSNTGIYFETATDNIILDNNITNTGSEGIYTVRSTGNNISGNYIYNSIADCGIWLDDDSDNNHVFDNTLVSGVYGIAVWGSASTVDFNTVNNNDISYFSDGIDVYAANNNTVTENTIVNGTSGIGVDSGYDNNITKNTAYNMSSDCAYITSSETNNFISNTLYECGDYCVNVGSSNNNIIKKNIMHNCDDYGLYLSSSSNNTAEDNNIYDNVVGGIYNYGGNNTFVKNIITNNQIGIYFSSTDGTVVSGNLFNNDKQGIYAPFESGSYCVRHCIKPRHRICCGWATVYYFNDELQITNNKLSDGDIGMYFGGQWGLMPSGGGHHTIVNNNIHDFTYGILLDGSSHNTISDSTLYKNDADISSARVSFGGPDNNITNCMIGSTTVTFNYSGEFNMTGLSNYDDIPEGYASIDKVLEIKNASAGGGPLEMSIYIFYPDSDLINIQDKDSLKLMRNDGTGWVDMAHTLNTTDNYVYADITEFSIFGIFGTPQTTQRGGGGGGGSAPISNNFTVNLGEEAAMGLGDIATFSLDGEQHSGKIIQLGVGSGFVVIEISSTPTKVTLYAGETKDVDINGDGKNDISVSLRDVISGKAYITFGLVKPVVTTPIVPTTEQVPISEEVPESPTIEKQVQLELTVTETAPEVDWMMAISITAAFAVIVIAIQICGKKK
jgi:parallel beta-helix repeat protein